MYALQLFCLCHTLSKYIVFTNALLQAFAPYCRVAIVRVKSTLAAKDGPPGNVETTDRFLETSKMCVAHILPTPAGCVEARPGPPPRAPSRHGRGWWRSLSKFQKVENENEPTREMTRSALRVASNVAAARLGGGLLSGTLPRGGPTRSSSTPAWPLPGASSRMSAWTSSRKDSRPRIGPRCGL